MFSGAERERLGNTFPYSIYLVLENDCLYLLEVLAMKESIKCVEHGELEKKANVNSVHFFL